MPEFKLFTLEEAERTLPLVRRVVQDLTVEYPAWRAAVGRFEVLTRGARAEWGETPELVMAREEVAAHATPLSLASGRLVVSVDHPTWATELRYLQSVVLGRLDEAVGQGVVRSLEVRVRPR